MTSSAMSHRSAAFALAVASIVLTSDAALAAQGPGTGAGTASSFTQFAMPIFVYGASALVVGAGLIGALRKSEPKP